MKKAEPSDREERDCHCDCEFEGQGERSQTVLAGRFGVFRADNGLSICPAGRMGSELWVSLACIKFSFSIGGSGIAGDEVWVRVHP